jgi:hypothetical protein
MRKFNHVGIPTTIPKEGEFYVEGMKLFLTDFSKSPNKIEFLRFEADSQMPEILKTHGHIAYEVPNLESAMEGKTVVLEPFQGGEGLTCAFIEEEGIAIELMCFDQKQTEL